MPTITLSAVLGEAHRNCASEAHLTRNRPPGVTHRADRPLVGIRRTRTHKLHVPSFPPISHARANLPLVISR
jgi:hypothetical protein